MLVQIIVVSIGLDFGTVMVYRIGAAAAPERLPYL
jgi:hypothetical protein